MSDILWRPFRLGTFLKISFIAMLAEVGCISFAVQVPLQVLMSVGQLMGQGKLPHGVSAEFMVVFLIAASVFAVVWFVLSYVFTRLRFVVFDFVVGRRTQVAESWRPYGPANWRYFGLNLLVMLVLMIVLLSVAAPFLIGFIHAIQTNNPAAIMPHMIAMMLGAFAVGLLVQLVDSVMRDFILPQMAIEDAAIEQAGAGCLGLLREYPGEVVLYLLLKFAITLGFGMALALVVLVCTAIVGLVLVGIGFALFHLLWAAGTGAKAVVVAYGVLGVLVLVALYLGGLIAASGISGVFRTAYAAYFFGSRYQPLGDRLDGAVPAAINTVPFEAPMPPPLPSPPPVW
jgi:hypothetical protein